MMTSRPRFLIVDSNLPRQYADQIVACLGDREVHTHLVKGGECAKSPEVYFNTLQALADAGLDRRGLILNVGGGTISDLGGFVASTFKRGVRFVNVSTTVEGMVDAALGGKNGLNIGYYKNYAGSISQPILVVNDINTLSTLSERDLISGWAEVIKYGLIADRAFYEQVTSVHPVVLGSETLAATIHRCCDIKISIVQKDPNELGLRKVLNFAHTIGHALESLSQESDRLRHGEAIAIGMVAESLISMELSLLDRKDYERIVDSLGKCGLPTRTPFSLQDFTRLEELIKGDKKNVGEGIQWSLIGPVGHCTPDVSVNEAIWRKACNVVVPSL